MHLVLLTLFYYIFIAIFFCVLEPKKDKTEGASQNGAVSPSTETPSHVSQPPGPGDSIGKLERPNTLAPGKLTRRLLCYHSEHCKFDIVLFFLVFTFKFSKIIIKY